MIFRSVLFILLCGGFVKAYFPTTNYCATFAPSTTGKAAGYFAMQIDEAAGLAYYNFKVDLSQFANSNQCNLANGLKYHIHSYWTNSTATSTFTTPTDSRCDQTGAHYDPYFACSTVSQFYVNKPNLCQKIYRTSAQGYTYSCNSTSFGSKSNSQIGKSYGCEVGDLNGKFGLVYGTNGIFQSSPSILVDPLPASVYDYLRPVTNGNYTSPWASIVFHCNNAPSNTRLFCAKLVTSTAACQASGAVFGTAATSSSKPAKSYSQAAFDGAVAGAAIVSLIAGIMGGMLFTKYNVNKQIGSSTGKLQEDLIPPVGTIHNPIKQ